MKRFFILASLLFLLVFIVILQQRGMFQGLQKDTGLKTDQVNDNLMSSELDDNPLTIAYLRNKEFPGSDLRIEETLPSGSNYTRYVASHQSEGLKIYGLLTIPSGEKPETGWPVVIFNHGYIPPTQYQTTERYVAYQDGFARNGYITYKSDYRGHGESEGEPAGGYGSNSYTVDVLNALASLKKHPDVDSQRIGMWGHSMGGFITLRSMVVRDDIKAGVIWAGVVASYPDLVNNWRRRINPSATPTQRQRGWRVELERLFGKPSNESPFWQSISANFFLKDISGPVQIHHGTADSSVPVEFSQDLEEQLKTAGKTVEYYEYAGDDHNLTNSFSSAIQNSIDFFDRHVKNEGN